MIKTTRWSPDTCECVLEYEWDTEDAKPNKDYTGRTVINACARHDQGANPNATFGMVLADNNAKNNSLTVLKDNFPILTKTNEEGDILLKPGAVTFNLRLDRVLELTIPLLDSAEKTQAQLLIGNELGDVDKVVVL